MAQLGLEFEPSRPISDEESTNMAAAPGSMLYVFYYRAYTRNDMSEEQARQAFLERYGVPATEARPAIGGLWLIGPVPGNEVMQ